MPETEVKNLEITAKPKCSRCGGEQRHGNAGYMAWAS